MKFDNFTMEGMLMLLYLSIFFYLNSKWLISSGGGTSLLDEVMSSWSATQASQARRQLPPTPAASTPSYASSGSTSSYYNRPQQPPAYHQAPSYRAPPPPVRPDLGLPSDLGLPLPSDYGLPTPRQGLFHPPGPSSLTNYEQRGGHHSYGQFQPHYAAPPQGQNVPPPLPRRNEAPMLSRSSSVMSTNSPNYSTSATSSHPYDLGAIGRSMSVQDNLERQFPPPLPTRNNMVKEVQKKFINVVCVYVGYSVAFAIFAKK